MTEYAQTNYEIQAKQKKMTLVHLVTLIFSLDAQLYFFVGFLIGLVLFSLFLLKLRVQYSHHSEGKY